MNLTEEARQMRNAYAREQYRKNREREIKRQEDYWNRKAAEKAAAEKATVEKAAVEKATAAAQAVKEVVDAAREKHGMVKTMKKKGVIANAYTPTNPAAAAIIIVPLRFGTNMYKRNTYESYLSSRINSADGWNSYLTLKREPDNPVDKNAVKVISKGEVYGEVGYVGKEYAELITEILKKRRDLKVEEVTGSDNIDYEHGTAYLLIAVRNKRGIEE